jgi:ribosomal protein S12 methylthiotransferase
MRGKHVTKPIEQVVAEARELAADGVRELILVAQDMTYYGVDLYGKPRLADLLRELDQIEGLDWIRILYNYPSYFTEELYDVLAGARRIIPYLDMPLQHINDRLLKVMNRRHTRAETEAIIARLRETIPGLVLRTTLIVGFPGETEAEFEELLDYVAETRFERLGVFSYSFEPDTPSAKLPGHIADDVKEARRARLMAVQQPIAEAFNRSLVGQRLEVLIDAPAPRGKKNWLGRPYTDAPDVDGLTLVQGADLRAGDLVACEIVAAEGYDLVARPVAASTPKGRRSRPRPRTRPASSLTILDGMP